MKKKIIKFQKESLKDLCDILNVPYNENIIAFTKEGVVFKRDFSPLEDRTTEPK